MTNQAVVQVRAGRTYFIRGGIHPGVVIWRPDLKAVPSEVGRSELPALRPTELKPGENADKYALFRKIDKWYYTRGER